MFPDMPLSDIHMVGNAAGAGAILALFDSGIAHEANGLSGATRILDLASLEAFQDTFVSSLSFPSR